MSIAIDSYCLLCYLNRTIDQARPLGTEEQAMALAKRLMQLYLDAPEHVASPWMAPHVSDLLHEIYGLEIDRFRQEKQDSNRFVLERMDDIREKIRSAPDPVLAGLQFSILGNYLDFPVLRNQISFDKLDDFLNGALEMELDKDVFGDFCRELEQGKKLLYLTDNAGEIGFDRLFAEELARKYPHLQITFCVRGDIANNDATREDAAAVGVPFPVIDNGNRIPGTQMDMLGREAQTAMDEADVIFAKGMANCETMLGCGYNVYYAFLVKCKRFVERFGKPMLTPVLAKERKSVL